MKTWLKWTLVLSTCGSAASLLWPADVEYAGAPSSFALPNLKTQAVLLAADLPGTLPPQQLQVTPKDLFASVPVPKPPPVAAAAPVVAAPPEPPRAPPMTYRYLGSFTGPDGAREIYLTRGDRSISVREGMPLEGGFMVAAISATAVNVLHTASQTRIDIPIAQKKD